MTLHKLVKLKWCSMAVSKVNAMHICFAMHVQNFSFNKLSVDLGFGSKAGTAEEEIFCWTYQNTDYHNHSVV